MKTLNNLIPFAHRGVLFLVTFAASCFPVEAQTNYYNPFIPALAKIPGAYATISNILETPAPDPFVPEISDTQIGPFGSYFTLGRNTPPLPANFLVGLPVYELDPTNRIFLVDTRGVDWEALNALRQEQTQTLRLMSPLTQQRNEQPQPLDLSQTGLLYIQVASNPLDGTNLSVVLRNTVEGQAYTVLTKEDLKDTSWAEEQLVYGAASDATPVQLARNSRTNLFVWARTGLPASTLAIVTQPLSQDVCEGDTVTFSVVAVGGSQLTYQWSWNGTNIDGATGSSYTIDTVWKADAGGYAVTVANGTTSVPSQTAQLTVEDGTGDTLLMALQGARQDYTFKQGTTYYIGQSGPVELYGTTKLMGGSVVRFDWLTNSSLVIKGSLICDTQPFLPCILTSIDDDSAGEYLTYWVHDGPPQPHAGTGPYLDLTLSQSNSIHDLRICYADIGVSTPASSGLLDIWDCQFVQCTTAITNAVWDFGAVDSLHNVLFAQCGTAIAATTNSIQVQGEHVTADVTNFFSAPSPAYKIALTNSIILGNLGDASAVIKQNVALNPEGPVFQNEGSAYYYLTAGSLLHNAGTNNISPRLLSEFQKKTTYPPVTLPAYMEIHGEMTLLPQVPRYSGGAPDLGYWYDNLDYSIANLKLNSGTLTLTPGTAIAMRNQNVPESNWVTFVGFDLWEGSSITSRGTPTRPNTITAERMVQETPDLEFVSFQMWLGGEFGILFPDAVMFVGDYEPNPGALPAPVMDFRFSNFYLPPLDYHYTSGLTENYAQVTSDNSAINMTLQDCSIYGGILNFGEPFDPWSVNASGLVLWKNNLFEQVSINFEPTMYKWGYGTSSGDICVQAYNNLFRGGLWFRLQPIPSSGGNWVFTDNFFDRVDLVQDTSSPLDFSHNGYWPLSSYDLWWAWWFYPWGDDNAAQLIVTTNGDGFISGVGETVLTYAPPYQVGPLGRYYLPNSTPLYGRGSRSAGDAGMFHYTTCTNQIKDGEETSPHMVNIGLHYVATSGPASATPRDTDGDGIPDYVENASGTGIVGANETDWNNQYTTPGVFDSTNSVYDDIDLSGSGLSGRIKKVLGIGPFEPVNPLSLKQVFTGEEPDTATFEVPVSYDALTSAGAALNLNMNGVEVTLGECTRAGNSNCLVSFNADYDPAGMHFLSANFRLGTEPGTPNPVTTAGGFILPFNSGNILQCFESGSMFDDTGAYLDAKLSVSQADYTIDLYDTSAATPAWIMTITNSTSNGVIQEDWGVTNADGTPFLGTSIQAVFNITPTGQTSGNASTPSKPRKNMTRAAGSLSEWGPNFDVVYMYTPTNSLYLPAFGNINGNQGQVWMGMQGVVDTLLMPVTVSGGNDNHYNSSFNRYTSQDFPGQVGFPGYVTSRAMITGTLLPDMTNGLTRQFYCYAHGNTNSVGDWSGGVYLGAGEVGRSLRNGYSKTNLVTQTPYRFVFMDGCSTATSMDWCRAFGIYRLDEANDAGRNKVGPQAYVGWAKDHSAWMNGEGDFTKGLNIAKAYTQTLAMFYADWMIGRTVKTCIDNQSFISHYGMAPFPVPENKIVPIYGDGYNYMAHVQTSRIYIIGFPGLQVGGVDRSLNSDTSYAPPKK